ncbi:hypothetical protein CPB83DRAFT_392541 [Crepidotus variabilis]|uniref:Uncharacterized protein n=1 Tax=Crepidotus variabilis TaxID=179855 RepID=A0A9P6EEF9_9AGAR|nr:hypothetical protein CPB83DRAFT_392541 [Crepidotus variabilis]
MRSRLVFTTTLTSLMCGQAIAMNEHTQDKIKITAEQRKAIETGKDNSANLRKAKADHFRALAEKKKLDEAHSGKKYLESSSTAFRSSVDWDDPMS